jgi:phosphatidylglycerophosphate synthase
MILPGHPPVPLPAAPSRPAAARSHPALLRDAARASVATLVLLLAMSGVADRAAGLGADFIVKTLLVFSAGGVWVWRGLRSGAHPHPRFGAANRVTLLRLAFASLLAALLGEAVPSAPLSPSPLTWLVVALAALTALLDAVDGTLARRSGLASRFGARFDMETDAAYTLVLCALVWQVGQAGPWVLAAGLMRYAFVGAALLFPWLAGPLAPSRRRQAICAVQIATLIACLVPIVPSSLASVAAATSLLLLSVSFAIDVRALWRSRRSEAETLA